MHCSVQCTFHNKHDLEQLYTYGNTGSGAERRSGKVKTSWKLSYHSVKLFPALSVSILSKAKTSCIYNGNVLYQNPNYTAAGFCSFSYTSSPQPNYVNITNSPSLTKTPPLCCSAPQTQYDEVEIEDMVWNEELCAFTYECPCGDLFQITREELSDGEEIAYCPSCTLFIKVIYDADDFAKDKKDGTGVSLPCVVVPPVH